MSTAVALPVGENWLQPRACRALQAIGTEQCQATMGMGSEPTHTKPAREVQSSEKNNPNNLLISTRKHDLSYEKRLCERVM